MSVSTKLSGQKLLDYIIENKAAIVDESTQNIVEWNIKQEMEEQVGPGPKLLSFNLCWDDNWQAVGVDEMQVINTHDDFAQSPEQTFWVEEDGTLVDGEAALAELRAAVGDCLEEFIEALRDQIAAKNSMRPSPFQ